MPTKEQFLVRVKNSAGAARSVRFLPGQLTASLPSPSFDSGGLKVRADTLISAGRNLTSVVIPSSVKAIAAMAFKRCNKLTSCSIPPSVTAIGSSAFFGCSLTSVVIPSSVTSIKEETFCYNSNLRTVTLPETIGAIGRKAFYGCRSLTQVLYDARCHEMQALLACRVKRHRDPFLNGKRVDFFVIALSTTGVRRIIASYIARRPSSLRFIGAP